MHTAFSDIQQEQQQREDAEMIAPLMQVESFSIDFFIFFF
jgi:hypothetical protein